MPQMDGSIVFARWRQCALTRKQIGAISRIRLKLCFLQPTRVHNPNGKSTGSAVFGRPLQLTVRPMLRDRYPVCLPCLSITLVYCGQTAGWIKMSFGTEVCLGPGDIVLVRDPAPPTERRTASPTFLPMSIVAKRSPILATAKLLLHSSRQGVVGHIGAIWRIRFNLCFLRPTRVHIPNGKSIDSVIFAQLTAEFPILYNGPPLPSSKLPIPMRMWTPT